MPRTTKHKVIYANSINLVGIYSTIPIRCVWDADLGSWWNKTGNFNVVKLGLDDDNPWTIFASVDRKEVMLWTRGVLSACSVIEQWAKSSSRI